MMVVSLEKNVPDENTPQQSTNVVVTFENVQVKDANVVVTFENGKREYQIEVELQDGTFMMAVWQDKLQSKKFGFDTLVDTFNIYSFTNEDIAQECAVWLQSRYMVFDRSTAEIINDE